MHFISKAYRTAGAVALLASRARTARTSAFLPTHAAVGAGARRETGARGGLQFPRRLGALGWGLLGLGGATIYLCHSVPSLRQASPSGAGGGGGGVGASVRISLPMASAGTLSYEEDRYEGVIVDEGSFPEGTEAFTAALEASVEGWRAEGKRGVWLKVPKERAALVPVAIEHGFELHHAEKAYIMLTRWLPQSEDQLPPNASHQVGLGAFVVNADGHILAVKEKHGPLRGTGVWKIPTGLLHAGEDLPHAAAREVEEETGLKSEFETVLGFRHGHAFLFGKSDLFFIVKMRLLSENPHELRPQDSEIEACQWMPLEEFTSQPYFAGTELFTKINDIMRAHAPPPPSGDLVQPPPSAAAAEAAAAAAAAAGVLPGSSGAGLPAGGARDGPTGAGPGPGGIYGEPRSDSGANGRSVHAFHGAETASGGAGVAVAGVGSSGGGGGGAGGEGGFVGSLLQHRNGRSMLYHQVLPPSPPRRPEVPGSVGAAAAAAAGEVPGREVDAGGAK